MSSDSTEAEAMGSLTHSTPAERRRLFISATARTLLGIIVITAFYIWAPFENEMGIHPATVLALLIIFFVALLAYSVRRIINDEHPQVRAAQVALMTTAIYLFSFAAFYLEMATVNPENFSEPVSRMDAFYLSVTIASTVGFGDITAETDSARFIVTAQMLINIILIGVGVRTILAIGKLSASRKAAKSSSTTADDDGDAPSDGTAPAQPDTN